MNYLQLTPLLVVNTYLSPSVYTKAYKQTLSDHDWTQRKAAIYLKSLYFQKDETGPFLTILKKVCNTLCDKW